MSVTVPKIRGRIQMKLHETDNRSGGFSSVEIDMAICDAYIENRSRLPAPLLYTASAFTITAGSDAIALPTTVSQFSAAEYAGLVRIQLVSNGVYLRKKTNEEMDALKYGQTTTSLGVPHSFAIYETSTQTVIGRCYPNAKAAEACNLWAPLMADDLRDFIGSGTDGLDEAIVYMDRDAATALEFAVAADLLETLPAEVAQERRLNMRVVDSWRKKSKQMFYRTEARRHNLNGVGRYQRWVS